MRISASPPRRDWVLRTAGLAAVLLLAAPFAPAAPAPAFDALAATRDYLAQVDGPARARSDAYFEGGYWLTLWNLVVALTVAGVMLATGLSARLRDSSERRLRRRWLRIAACGLGYLAIAAVLTLPWDYYTGFLREHQYGMSNQTTGAWLGEWLVSQIITLVLATPVLLLLYAAIRRSPARWWIRAAIATPFLLLFILLVAPVFIAPRFNTYTPVTDPAVRDPILRLARANGIPAENVYEFDASRQTKRISANVSGALGTLRISLNDNLLRRCSPAEIRAVMAHEMGHYVLNHSYKLIVELSLVMAAGLAFTAWFSDAVRRRFGARWGVRGADDPAGLPILVAGLAVFLFLATPVTNGIVRSAESEADLFGLNAAREPDGFATTALKLSEYRKLAPGPLEEALFYDHPSGRTRILMAMRWKAENLPAPAAP